jgi:hypothetical protein
MVRRKHLPEGEIQRLERLDNADRLGTELGGFDDKQLLEKFHELLVAYRLAARVANRAFTYVEAPLSENLEALTLALKDYAPAHFEAVVDERAQMLIELYEKSDSATLDELRELIYKQIETLQKGST